MTKDEERLARLRLIVAALPNSPGCYQYLDESGKIIYVGKAKNLKNRVSSYFHKTVDRRKTEILVSKIHDIKYVVVSSDMDALLLENNLIKKYKPHYNILLKDGKTYPSVCVTKEYLPRVFKTRNRQNRGATYYGPFSHIGTLNNILELIKRIYNLRRCHKAMSKEGIEAGKFKPCLEYHLKNCKAPCARLQSHEEYMQQVEEVKEILSGNTRQLCRKMYEEMQLLAAEMRFEEAMLIKKRYDLALEYCERSEVVSHSFHNIDVFSIEDEEKTCFINYLHVTNGSINQAFTFEYKKRIDETPEDMLALGIAEMRERYHSTSREIVIPFPIDLELDGITFTIPERGEKKHLLELSLMNVRQYRIDSLKQAERLNPEQRNTNILKELQRKLGLEKLPMRIEIFDNSNISGSDAVAGCVVYKQAKPARSEYRKFNIKTVTGPDDYASMKEVVYRKYHRALDEKTELPDLIVCDGGKGQMEIVREVIQDELHIDIPIAGLAKDNRHRTNELLFGFPQQTVGVETDSPLFKFLTRMQDEVHRFAITFHREKRSKNQTRSELDAIKGIGPETKKQLLRTFKSLKRIKEASPESLAEAVGAAKSKILIEAFAHTRENT
jgi:excinuclease ABC subunit C